MKNFRVLSMALLFVLPLLFGSGCQMIQDLFGVGWQDNPDGLVVPNPGGESDLPIFGNPDEGPVKRQGGWGDVREDLKLPTIYFSYDKFSIGAREKKILDQVAAYMQKNQGLGLIIEGHCDERGSDEYNRSLGERRALAVHDYLITIDIPSDRLQTQSFGEERLSVKGADESAHSKNRRAELMLANMQ